MPKSPAPNRVNSLSWLLLCAACLLVPVGRAISQEVQVTVEAGAGYDDNVGTSANGGGSSFTNANAVVTYNRPTGRTQIHLIGVAGFTPYSDAAAGTPQQDVDLNITLALTHNISSRLSFDASVYAAYQTEPNFQSNVGPLNVRSDHFNTDDTFSLSYHWMLRVATVTSYTVQRVKYDDASIGSFEDRTENTFGESLQFSLTSRTNLIGDYRFAMSDYDTAPLNSTTHYLLGGIDHHLMKNLTVHALGGATFSSFDIGKDTVSPHFEGSVSYANTDHSSLSWSASYGTEAPNMPGVLFSTTFRAGMGLTYNLSTRISSTAGVYYSHTENEAPTPFGTVSAGSQDAVDFSLGLRYTINRHFDLHIDYGHSTVGSMGSAPGYSRNSYSGGLSFRY